MKRDSLFLNKKNVLIYGATGGMGSGIAEYYSAQGANVVVGGRNKEKCNQLREKLGLEEKAFIADLVDGDSIYRGVTALFSVVDRIDILIITAGNDIRKAYHNRSQEEISKTIAVNFTGISMLIHAFLPYFQKSNEGQVALIGGFGDGRLALPCHSLDAAVRSGIATLFDSISNENRNKRINFLYFCPPAVNTATEKPYLNLWKELKIPVIDVEDVAKKLTVALRKRKRRVTVGSKIDSFGIWLNSAFPEIAKIVFLNKMGARITAYVDLLNRETQC